MYQYTQSKSKVWLALWQLLQQKGGRIERHGLGADIHDQMQTTSDPAANQSLS